MLGYRGDTAIIFVAIALILVTDARLRTFGLLNDGRRRADFGSRFTPAVIRLSDFGKESIFQLETGNKYATESNFTFRPIDEMPPRRFKRDDNEKLIVKLSVLPDEGHNEAVVHWSGQKSQVCALLIWAL
jgi:hypothetical protein